MESKSDNHDNDENHGNDENVSFPFLKKIKSERPKNLFFGQLNVNSIRNKFESVQEIIQNTFDIFLACKTKIDSSSLSGIVFTSEISNKLTFYLSTHDNILLMGDFNMTPNNPKLSELIADHELCTLYQNQHVSKVSILLVLITS